jgi:hypothetical protein
LALSPGAPWSLTDLAVRAEASVSLASLVVRELNRQGLVAGEVTHGRRGTVRATRRLFDAVGAHWPIPIAWVRGGRLPDDRPLGGGSALHRTGVLSVGHSRVYLRSVNDLPALLAATGGALVSEPVADWEVAVLDLALPAGPVPLLVAALKLSGSPRGREILATRLAGLLAVFDEPEGRHP